MYPIHTKYDTQSGHKTIFIYLSILLIFTETFSSDAKQLTDTDSNPTTATKDSFEEHLFLKPLVDGKLFAQFQFKTVYRKDLQNLRWENEFQLFPMLIADLVSGTDLNKLHFSLTKSNWNYKSWGYSTRPSPPGAQIRVLFSKRNQNLNKSWEKLVNSLAGLFCTSLISASNRNNIINSRLAFNHNILNSQNATLNDDHFLYVNLPEETLCTENLTPWKKLLPCKSDAGLSSLLNSVQLLKSTYSSLAVDLEPIVCEDQTTTAASCKQVQLTQTISVVFNPLHLFENKQTWSLAKIFGNSILYKCPVARKSYTYVDVSNFDDIDNLYPTTFEPVKLKLGSDSERTYAFYDINQLLTRNEKEQNKRGVNIGIKQNHIFKQKPMSSRPQIPIHFETHIAGLGSSGGTMVGTIINRSSQPIRITYMDMVPSFLKVYFHTISIRTTSSNQELKPDKLNFVLSKDSSSALIEFSLVLPANREIQVSYDFERTFLRWTDFKPDANKGILINSAMIDITPCCQIFQHLTIPTGSLLSNSSSLDCEANDERHMFKIYARPLLIILPTPDFSMPYNVICLVCTVLMIAFGPLHSFTTRRPIIQLKKKPAIREKEVEGEETKKDQ